MSTTSPSDLTVAFRSLPRRLREIGADLPPTSAGEHGATIASRLAEAGRLMGTEADPMAIAEAIESMPTRQWDEDRLGRLRDIALDIGACVRMIGSEAPESDDTAR